jgi:hypothetical protein
VILSIQAPNIPVSLCRPSSSAVFIKLHLLLAAKEVCVLRAYQKNLPSWSKGVLESQTSQSVADALGAIEQDAYVMDYKLPDGTGLDIAERIRSKWGATPIIPPSRGGPQLVSDCEKPRINLGIWNILAVTATLALLNE